MENYFSSEENAKLLQSELEKRYGAGKVTVKATEEGYTVEIEGNETYNLYENGEIAKKLSREGLKVGDYINYKPGASAEKTYPVTLENFQKYTGDTSNTAVPEQEDGLKWRILRINENGSIDLISDPTSKDIYFKGSVGYNNGVYLMNDICEKLYSNTEEGIKARSVNLEDMEKWLTDQGKAEKEKNIKDIVSGLTVGTSYIESVDLENNQVTYKMYRYYPLIWKIEQEKKLKESDRYYTDYGELTTTEGRGTSYEQEAEKLTIERTIYGLSINKDNYGDGANVLSNSNYYWVASRYISCNDKNALFGLRGTEPGMGGCYMYDSPNNPFGFGKRLRVVVSIGSDVQVTPSNDASSETGTPHTINW